MTVAGNGAAKGIPGLEPCRVDFGAYSPCGCSRLGLPPDFEFGPGALFKTKDWSCTPGECETYLAIPSFMPVIEARCAITAQASSIKQGVYAGAAAIARLVPQFST
jgi:hypothetical protein